MIARFLKNFLYRKLALKRRDVLLFFIFFAIFFVSKNFILDKFLNFSAMPYNISLKSKDDWKITVVKKENADLKNLLDIKQSRKNVVFGKVLTNIYSTSTFWAVFSDASHIEKGMIVWARDSRIGDRLIGFVESKKNNCVKIKPLTNRSSRFSANLLNGSGLLLKGTGRALSIALSNAECIVFDELVVLGELKVGRVKNENTVSVPSFARVKWICINIS